MWKKRYDNFMGDHRPTPFSTTPTTRKTSNPFQLLIKIQVFFKSYIQYNLQMKLNILWEKDSEQTRKAREKEKLSLQVVSLRFHFQNV